MPWIVQKPEVVTDLTGALSRCRTEAARQLVAGYAALLSETGGAIPAKNGLDLRRFAGALPDLMLAAVSQPDKWICRLAGEGIRGRLGRNPVGGNYYDLVPAERLANAQHAMNMVIDAPSGFRAELAQAHADGRVRLSEALALPLTSDEAGVDGFILFADSHLDDEINDDPARRAITATTVLRRDLIDLGYGVDESFVDLVPA